MLDGKLHRTFLVVKGVGRHGVVVYIIVSYNIEKHAIRFSISKALAFCFRFAELRAGGEGILATTGVEKVR
jgi:hypothetical protein